MATDTILPFRELIDSDIAFQITDDTQLFADLTAALLRRDLEPGDSFAETFDLLLIWLRDKRNAISGVPGWEIAAQDVSVGDYDAIMFFVEPTSTAAGFQCMTGFSVAYRGITVDDGRLDLHDLNLTDNDYENEVARAWMRMVEEIIDQANIILHEFRR